MRFTFPLHAFVFVLLLSPFTITGNFQNVFAANLTPVADLTGQWSGFAQFTIPGGYCEYSGNVNAYLEQDGNNIAGEFSWVATSSKSSDPEIYECDYRGQTYSDNVQGTISGSQITLYSSEASFTGWYASSGIKLDIVFDDSTIGITQLSPTGFSPPAFTPEDEPAPPPQEEKDSDGDGIPDDVDQCIGLLEDYYGENEEDGCPEKDSDGDNIYDYIDACPYDKEDFGENFTDGCPEIDSDDDGWLDPEDACPNDPEDYFEFGKVDGCPEKDSDGDNIYDSIDQCIYEPEDTVGDTDGCPNYSTEDEFVEDEFAEDEFAEEEEMMEETQQIFENYVLGNLKVNQGSVTVTTADGKVVNTNELKIGDTIQTGTNADTNVKIALENGDVINLQENTKLGTFEIIPVSDEDLSYLFDQVEQIKNNPSSGGVDEDLSYLFDQVEQIKKKSIIDQIDEKLNSFLSIPGLSQKESDTAYITALFTGLALGTTVAIGTGAVTVVGGALIITGIAVMIGGVYFETYGIDAFEKNQIKESFTAYALDEKNQRVIFTPHAVLFPHGTEFTVTVEDGATKLDVMEGEVFVVPLDTNQPVTTITSGNSVLVSNDKVEETKLDTSSVDKWWEVSAEQESKSGGCLIATATYGSELAPQVQFLRETRDNTVLSTASGTSFMTAFNSFYYLFSPTVADLERQNPVFKEAVKITITPLISSLSLLQYADIDSEAEMLGYGIGIILLNIGMYFVAPALIIFKLKNRK